MEPAIDRRMKQLLPAFAGWLASVIFIATATVLWGGALLIVFLSGNRTLQGRS